MKSKKRKKSKKKKKPVRAVENKSQASQSIPGFSNFSREEFAEDIVWLLRTKPDSLKSPDAAAEFAVKTVLPTYDLATEPEFEKIVHNPLHCAKTVFEVTRELEINTESFASLPEALAESIRSQIIEETAKRVLSDEFRQDILDGLNKYRLRKKRSGEKTEAGRAAAMMLIVKEKKNEAVWPKIGLLHGIIQKCAAVGNEIMENLADIKDGWTDRRDGISEKIKDDPRIGKYLLEAILRETREGNKALLEGRLNLGLFTSEEIERATRVFTEAMKVDAGNPSGNVDHESKESSADAKTIISEGLFEIIDEVVTPERIAEAREKIRGKLNSGGENEKWRIFLLETLNTLDEVDTVEPSKNFFITALYGETTAAAGSKLSEKDRSVREPE